MCFCIGASWVSELCVCVFFLSGFGTIGKEVVFSFLLKCNLLSEVTYFFEIQQQKSTVHLIEKKESISKHNVKIDGSVCLFDVKQTVCHYFRIEIAMNNIEIVMLD